MYTARFFSVGLVSSNRAPRRPILTINQSLPKPSRPGRRPLRRAELRGRPSPAEETTASSPRLLVRRNTTTCTVFLLLLAQPPGRLFLCLPVHLLPMGAVVHKEDNGSSKAKDDQALDDPFVAELVAAAAAEGLPVAARDAVAVVVLLVGPVVVLVVVRVFLQEVGDPLGQRPVLPLRCSVLAYVRGGVTGRITYKARPGWNLSAHG